MFYKPGKFLILCIFILFFSLLISGVVTAGVDLKFTSINAIQDGDNLKITHTIRNQGTTASDKIVTSYSLREKNSPLITDNGHQTNPYIYGNSIVYQDNQNGNWDIYLYSDTYSQKKRITTSSYNEINPVISGNYIVYEVVKSISDHDIMMYNTQTNQYTQIFTSPSSMDCNPDIWGDNLVWQSNYGSNGIFQIWRCNLKSSPQLKKVIDMKHLISDTGNSINPSISSNKIVFQFKGNFIPDGSTGPDWNIWVYDFSVDKLSCVCSALKDQANPKIFMSNIVWEDYRNGNWDIYYQNLNSPVIQGTPISKSPSRQTHPEIGQDYVAWEDNRNGNFDIYLYCIPYHYEERITYDSSGQYGPVMNFDSVWWIDARNGENNNLNIYKSTSYGGFHGFFSPILPGTTVKMNYSIPGKKILKPGLYLLNTVVEESLKSQPSTSYIKSGWITVEYTKPIIKSTIPTNNAINVMGSQVIQINFSETIQAGVNYSKITLLNSSNKIMPITEKIYGNSLYITSMNKYTHGTIYTLIIPLNSIKDLRGNILSTTYKTSFKVEQTPPKLISTTPSNLKMGFSRTADITIKFNELIQSSVNFNKITVKNLTTNKNITFSKIYFYENIIITTPTRAPNTWYQVTIPTTAIQDWAGNQQKTPHIFKFRTGT